MIDDVASRAMSLATENKVRIDSHEELCALRYAEIHKSIDTVNTSLTASINSVNTSLSNSVGEIKKVLGWVGSTVTVIVIAALAFFLKAQFDSNAEMQRQLAEMQHESR